MDLVAYASGQTVTCARSLHLSQRLWTVRLAEAEDANVVCVAWHPDGRVLAAGCTEGRVHLVETEGGRLLRSVLLHVGNPRPVRLLLWTQRPLPTTDAQKGGADPILDALPALAPLNTSSATGGTSGGLSGTGSDALSVLVASDGERGFCLSAAGIFSLGSIAPDDGFLSTIGLETAYLANDLSSLYAVLSASSLSRLKHAFHDNRSLPLSPTKKGPANDPKQFLLIFDTSLLTKSTGALNALATKAQSVQHLLRYVTDVMDEMKNEYAMLAKTQQEYTKKLDQFMQEHAEASATPASECLMLLATGTPSQSMTEFMKSLNGSKGCEKWQRQVESCHKRLRVLLHAYLRPSCERILIHLTDLLGQSRWPGKTGIGIGEKEVQEAIHLVSALIVVGEEARCKIDSESQMFIHFIGWLSKIAETHVAEPQEANTAQTEPEKKINIEYDISKAIKYIRHTFDRAPLQHYFKEAKPGATMESARRTTSTESFVSAVSTLSYSQQENLWSLYESLEQATCRVFESCAKQVSNHFVVRNISEITCKNVDDVNKEMKMHAFDEGCAIFIYSKESTSLTLQKILSESETQETQLLLDSLMICDEDDEKQPLNTSARLIDVSFYSDDDFVVLLSVSDANGTSHKSWLALCSFSDIDFAVSAQALCLRKYRVLPYKCSTVVSSGKRQICCVVSEVVGEGQRIGVFEMDRDEEEEDDIGDEDEGTQEVDRMSE